MMQLIIFSHFHQKKHIFSDVICSPLGRREKSQLHKQKNNSFEKQKLIQWARGKKKQNKQQKVLLKNL
jgi:hypothetical protein